VIEFFEGKTKRRINLMNLHVVATPYATYWSVFSDKSCLDHFQVRVKSAKVNFW